MPRINVSFKQTTRDMKLYDIVNSKEKNEKSEFVKNALEYYVEFLKGKKGYHKKCIDYKIDSP